MSIKKYSSGSWVSVPYRKYETATDTITSLPKTIIGDGQNISAWSMKGNMSQSGTPTPSNPIYPQECGEETANLYNKNARDTNNGFDDTGYLVASGSIAASSSYQVTEYIAVEAEQTYTLTYGTGARNYPSICFYDDTKTYISGEKYDNILPFTFTTPQNTAYIRFSIGDASTEIGMLNLGSTALPYEPYGYKIPISFDSNTYTFYLNEPIRKIGDSVDTAPSTVTASRVVKKYVFTGDEDWVFVSGQGTGLSYLRTKLGTYGYLISDMCVSSHYSWTNITSSTSESGVDSINSESANMSGVAIRDTVNGGNATTYKRYLADQYAAGTPVTVWVVLASAETETFTAPSIPTSGSPQSFDVSTTLKPSEVSLTYHGWHEHSDTKYTNP